uniref:Uncharacterized protein n=1 Tax=Arundo donax TaxID=35708 RepID=A0A0A8ZNP4_ARUDO
MSFNKLPQMSYQGVTQHLSNCKVIVDIKNLQLLIAKFKLVKTRFQEVYLILAPNSCMTFVISKL